MGGKLILGQGSHSLKLWVECVEFTCVCVCVWTDGVFGLINEGVDDT